VQSLAGQYPSRTVVSIISIAATVLLTVLLTDFIVKMCDLQEVFEITYEYLDRGVNLTIRVIFFFSAICF